MAVVVSVFLCATLAYWYKVRKNRRRALWLKGQRPGAADNELEATQVAQEKDGVAIIGELGTRANTHELSPDAEMRSRLFELSGY